MIQYCDYILALIPRDLFAVRSGLGGAVGRTLDLTNISIMMRGKKSLCRYYFTCECVCHFGPFNECWLVVPQLLLVTTGHIWHYELDILGHQLALLPGHRLTGIIASPHLVPISIRLPQRDTVLLGHIATLRKELAMRDCSLPGNAGLLHKQFWGELCLCKLLRLNTHRTLSIRSHLKH